MTNTQTQAATTGAGSFIYTRDGNNNTIVGGSENDTIVTGTGNNLVIMGSGNSTYAGGLDVTSVLSGWAVAGYNLTSHGQIGATAVQFAATAVPAANYYGNTFINSSGALNAVGAGNDTIVGGVVINCSGANDTMTAGLGSHITISATVVEKTATNDCVWNRRAS